MESLSTIAANGLEATVSSQGAQLMSLKKEGCEYLWQGDERWWPRRAPVLFPIVGSIRGDHATSAAGPISLGRHGIARNCAFELSRAEDDTLVYRLASNEETLARFPYEFELEMSYEIEGEALRQTFYVRNTGEEDLPFVLGGHPAFNIPAGPERSDSFDQYRLEFAEDWTYATPRIDTSTGLLDFGSRIDLLSNSRALQLTHGTFDVDTLVFEDVPQRTIRLVGPSGHGVQVDFGGFDFLGVWSAAGDAPFVALEPWTGCATATDESDVFEEKRGIEILQPGATSTHSFTMRPF